MTKETVRDNIVRAISDSKFQIDFIDNDVDGSLVIKVSRPTKMNTIEIAIMRQLLCRFIS